MAEIEYLAAWLAFLLAFLLFLVHYWTYSLATNEPTDDTFCIEIDNEIRKTRLAYQERLDIDHEFPISGDAIDGTDVGKHKQVTFKDPISTPTPGTDEGILYTKTAGTTSELHFVDENSNEKQITNQGKLNVTGTDIPDDTIDTQHLNVPSAGADADGVAIPVIAWGSYTGNGGTQTITAFASGIQIRHIVIHANSWIGGSTDPCPGVEGIITGSSARYWTQSADQTDYDRFLDNGEITVSTNQFTLDHSKTYGDFVNKNAIGYSWYAVGAWAT